MFGWCSEPTKDNDEMCQQINDVTLAIEQGNTAMIEYANAIRDIEWEVFDLLQDQISDVTEEADFLIDLLSSENLYDDRGQLTNEGMSTMGLHGMNYNVHMLQADKYAQEMLKVNQQLAQDPYNKELIKRRQELLELQRESILAAEDEKQAIVDMVKEGIELELDALQELIDKYTEALDSQKDLYDYTNKIQDQIENIASLEKQMSAYSGDDSEETRSKIQQIKVDLEEARKNLEETEYDKYISDQKQLLDELYLEYETILNQRLDNIDALIEDMISEINNNASIINSTLSTKADEVGYTLSDAMKATWDTSTSNITNVLTTYGSGVQTSVENAIAQLEIESAAMKAALDINAMNEISTITTYGDDIKAGMEEEGTKLDANTESILNAITDHRETLKTSIDNAASTLGSAISSLGSDINGLSSKLDSVANQKTTPTTTPVGTHPSTTQPSSSTTQPSSSGFTDIFLTAANIIKDGADKAKATATKGVATTANKVSSSSKQKSSKDNTTTTVATGAVVGGITSIFTPKKDTTPKSTLDTDTSIVDRLKYNNYDSSFSARSDYYSSMGFSGTYIGSATQNAKMIDWMEGNGHRDGVYKLSKDELAWTQEGRELEAIIRPSDGAILTPLAKNDSVLKASATSNIFNFANDPSGFIRENLNIVSSTSDVPRQQSIGGTYDNEFNIQIELPNVTNYEQFKYAMQHDKSFEKMIKAMTVDKMFGGSSLKKYKY